MMRVFAKRKEKRFCVCVCFFRNTFYVLMEIGRPLFTKSGSFIKSRKKGKFGMDFLLPRERENRRTNVNLTLNTLRNVCVFPSFSMRHFYQTIYQFSNAHFLLTHRVSRPSFCFCFSKWIIKQRKCLEYTKNERMEHWSSCPGLQARNPSSLV